MSERPAVLLLILLLVRGSGEISGEQEEMRILHPAPDVVVSAVSPLEMRCSFAGLRGAKDFAVTIDLDEFDGGEFPIAADGEYTFTLPPLAEGRHQLFMALLRTGEVRVSQRVKRDLLQCQKRPTTVSKETYYSVKRDLLQCQKRPTTVSKETYYSVKRDLLQCQK